MTSKEKTWSRGTSLRFLFNVKVIIKLGSIDRINTFVRSLLSILYGMAFGKQQASQGHPVYP